jgi:type I restriction-modification system DNA methylase subunit
MTQITIEKFNELLNIKESYQAPAKLMEVLYDKPRREQLFKDFLEATDYDVNEDTFRQYFEDEHADRRITKQDFTPTSIAKLTRALVGDTNGSFYEGCAGTGSMTIQAWHQDRMQHSPFDYKPSFYFYHVEEISDRAIPFLIFNLALRGMNAVVVHCDVLSRKAHGVFFIQNDVDDHFKFSSINRMPYSKDIENLFAINFVDERYPDLLESPENLPHVANPPKKEVSVLTQFVYALCGVSITNTETDNEDVIEIDTLPAVSIMNAAETEPLQMTLF